MENKKTTKTALNIDENIEGLLCYALGFITGIVFLVLEKENKFVRFHAMQSTITFLGFTMASFILSSIPLIGPFFGWLIGMAAMIVWIICIIKAYQGEKFKLPIIGDLSEKHSK